MSSHILYGIFGNGKLDEVKKICKEGTLDMYYDDDIYLRTSIRCGHIQVAEYLLKNYQYDIHFHIAKMFLEVCQKGLLDMAKWLHSIPNSNISYSDAMMKSVEQGQLE